MKNLIEYINESLPTKDERELKKLGFKKEEEGKETWFEMTYKKQLLRIVQKEVGDNNWWLAKVESDYVLDADDKPMTFETPFEAAEEAMYFVDENHK